MKRVLLTALLAACSQRTELMIGVATDLRAPDAINAVDLDVIRLDNGRPELQVHWDITGNSLPDNLPGSYGVFSDGEEVRLDVRLRGTKGDATVVDRRAILTLVEGETLFYRMGLTAACIGREDCPEDFSCVEGVCRDANVPSNQLPDFSASLVTELTCNGGTNYLQTETGETMAFSADAGECPAGLCFEGTCLKPPPTGGGTRTVRGSRIRTFVQPDKLTPVPQDLSSATIAAIIQDADGNATTIPGVGNADGTFAIQGVPKGTYTFKFNNQFFVTSADNIDLGFLDLGRPDVAAVTSPETTGINFNVTGMTAWQDGDVLSAYSPEANMWWFFFDDDASTTPPLNSTALTNVPLTYDNQGTAGFDLMKNDAFSLLHYTSRSAGDAANTKYQTVSQSLVVPSLTTTNGQLTPVSGAFTAVPQTETISFDVRQLDWERTVGWNGTNALLLNPQATPVDFSVAGITGNLGGVNLDVFGQPGGNTYGQFSATLDYLFITAPEGRDSTFSNLTFSKPHITAHEFGVMLSSAIGYRVQYQLPGSSSAANQFLNYGSLRPVNSDTVVVNPLLGPVRDAAINDRDIFTAQQGVPPTSRISWKAPSLGIATLYRVSFFKLSVDGGNKTVSTLAGTVNTTNTFLDIPAGLLEPTQAYYFLINATDFGNIDAPFRRRLPESNATVASAIITIGAGSGGGDLPDAGTNQPVDAPTGGVCDLEIQNCPGGKCTVFGGTEVLCRPEGAIPLGGTCVGSDNQDDCRAGGICIFRQCRELCGDNHTCGGGEKCIGFGVFATCLTTCNALTPSCPSTAQGTQNCYENTDGTPGGTCINSPTNTPVGQTCSNANSCIAGAGCLGNKCLAYCNFTMFPNTQGTCGAGETCQNVIGNGDGVGACMP